MSDDKETSLSGNAYVTVYHTVNVTIGMAWLAVPAVAIVALIVAWRAAA